MLKDVLAEQAGALEMQVLEARKLAVKAYAQPWSLTQADIKTLNSWQQSNDILLQALRSPSAVSAAAASLNPAPTSTSASAAPAAGTNLSPGPPFASVEGSPQSALE